MAYTCHYWIRGLCDGVIWRRKITNTAVFPGDAVIKNPSASEGDTGDFSSTPGSGKSPGGGNIHSCQYFFFFFLENPMDRGACWATVGGVAKNRTRLTMNKQTPSVRNFIISKYRHKMTVEGTSLVVQWLRYHTLSEENPGSISGQGTRFHMPQLRVLMLQQGSKISHAATKTQSNQINTYNNDFFFF